MADEKMVTEIVHAAIAEVNEQLPADRQVGTAPDTLLFDRKGALDSLGLVNLIVAVEQTAQERTGTAVSLSDVASMSLQDNPFRTVGTLVAFIGKRLDSE